MLLYKNVITTQVILGKKEVFDNIKFDESLPRFQDWDLVIRISNVYKVTHLDEVLLDLYVQKDSITNNYNKGIDGLSIIYNKYENEFNEKQKSRILIRRSVFKSLAGQDADNDFKEALKIDGCFKNRIIYLFYKIKLLNIFYKLIK